jgi:hypothetical protein
MVTLYVGGQKVDWADAGRVLGEASPLARNIELRNESGQAVTRVVLEPVAPRDDDPDWVKAITPEETARRMAEPGFTFEEMKKRLGWEWPTPSFGSSVQVKT